MHIHATNIVRGMVSSCHFINNKIGQGIMAIVMLVTLSACVTNPNSDGYISTYQAKALHPQINVNDYQPISVVEIASQGFIALHSHLPIGTRLKIVNPRTQYEIIVVVAGKPKARQSKGLALSHAAARKLGLNPRRNNQVLYQALPRKAPYKYAQKSMPNHVKQVTKQSILQTATMPPANTVTQTYLGKASYYAHKFHGRTTANGETYDMHAMTCAHKSLPFNTKVRVTNRNNGRSIVLRVNDRGPFKKGRIVDVSYGAAKKLGMIQRGIVPVKVEVLLEDTGTRV